MKREGFSFSGAPYGRSRRGLHSVINEIVFFSFKKNEYCYHVFNSLEKKENYMLKILGVIINLGIIAYLGYQAALCLGPEQIADLHFAQNPLILSFVAVVALFIALKN
jgi:hypothetical protein